MQTIAVEEHFTTKELQAALRDSIPDTASGRAMQAKLLNLDEDRLTAMDAGGVDMQVLALPSAGFETVASDAATGIVRAANDELAEAIGRHPTRLAGYASLNLKDVAASVKEFERCVERLGFHAAMVHGRSGGAFLDDARFLPLWEAAEALGVPVYVHPAPPPRAVYDAYFTGLPGDCGRALSINGWGWHAETGMHVLRLILSGLFDRFPAQQILIGHMGENLPFSLMRAATTMRGVARHLQHPIEHYFHANVHVSTSGYFTQAPFACAAEVVGVDRLLFAVDYPFSENTVGKAFLESLTLSSDDREKLTGGNARKLLKLRPA